MLTLLTSMGNSRSIKGAKQNDGARNRGMRHETDQMPNPKTSTNVEA